MPHDPRGVTVIGGREPMGAAVPSSVLLRRPGKRWLVLLFFLFCSVFGYHFFYSLYLLYLFICLAVCVLSSLFVSPSAYVSVLSIVSAVDGDSKYNEFTAIRDLLLSLCFYDFMRK